MTTGISPGDKIENKSVWLSDTENDSVRMSSLKKTGSILRFHKAMEKESIVDNNGVESTSLRMSGLGEIIGGLEKISSILYYDRMTKKRLIVNDNGVGFTSLEISGLGEISLSLYCKRRLQYRRNTFKGYPTCFCIKSSILL